MTPLRMQGDVRSDGDALLATSLRETVVSFLNVHRATGHGFGLFVVGAIVDGKPVQVEIELRIAHTE